MRIITISDMLNWSLSSKRCRGFKFYIWRLSISIDTEFYWGYFDNTVLDCRGVSFGWVTIAWWYDDIPEGLKS